MMKISPHAAIFFFVFVLCIPLSSAMAQCYLSAVPTSFEAGGTATIVGTYMAKTEMTDALAINCGNGRTVAAFQCTGASGYCSASCYYPYPGIYTATATVDTTDCQPVTLTVNEKSNKCGDGVCSAADGESPQTCPADCGELRYCGDGICSMGESPSTCPKDCGAPVTTCSDGTRYSTCSASQPYYCDNGMLVKKSSLCNCPSGKVASGDDCIDPVCIDGTARGSCSLRKPLYCNSALDLVERSSLCGCPFALFASGDSCFGPGACQSISAYAIDTTRNVPQGTDAHYQFLLSNPTNQSQQVSIAATMPALVEGTFSESTFNLAPGAYAQPELILYTDQTTPGNYSVSVEASSFNCKKQVPVSLNIAEPGASNTCCSDANSVSASLDKQSAILTTAGSEIDYTMYLRNNADFPVMVYLSAPSSPFPVTFSKMGFQMDGNADDSVTIKVIVPTGTPGNQFSIPFMVKYSTSCCIREFPVLSSISVSGPRAAVSMINETYTKCMPIPYGQGEQRIMLGLRNDGDIRFPFTLAVKEKAPLSGNVRLSESRLELESGETGFFSLFVNPANLHVNYTYTYSFSASTAGYTLLNRNYCFYLVKPASTPTPTAPHPSGYNLVVTAPNIDLIEGINSTFDISVTNPSAAIYDALSLGIDGIPSSWIVFYGNNATLMPFTTKTYAVYVYPYSIEGLPTYKDSSVTILSGNNAAGQANTTLTLSKQVHQLDYSYTIAPTIVSDNQVSAMDVTMVVVNHGNVPEYYVTPAVTKGADLNFSATPASINLEPGETGEFHLTFWPSGERSETQNVPVTFNSKAGSAATKVIALPSMTGLAFLGRELPWWVVAIAGTILVAIAMILISNYKEPNRMR